MIYKKFGIKLKLEAEDARNNWNQLRKQIKEKCEDERKELRKGGTELEIRKIPTIFNNFQVPPVNNIFTSREEMLEDIVETLKKNLNKKIVICGGGGTGKTEIAIEYLHNYAKYE